MNITNKYRETLAEARAIHLAMRGGVVGYQEAKKATKPYLDTLNEKSKKLARKHNVAFKRINFRDLGYEL